MDLGADVDDGGGDEDALLRAVLQAELERGDAVVAAECAVSVEVQAALALALRGLVAGHEVLDVVLGRGGEAELVPDEVVEDGPGVAADGPVGLVGDDKVEIGGGEVVAVLVVVQERLDCGDDDLGPAPLVPRLLVDDGREVVLEVVFEVLLRLVLQFEAVDEEQDAAGVGRFQEQLDDCGPRRASCRCRWP